MASAKRSAAFRDGAQSRIFTPSASRIERIVFRIEVFPIPGPPARTDILDESAVTTAFLCVLDSASTGR